MKNADQWQPSKFVKTPDGYRASRDPNQVGVSSRFTADILAQRYAALLQQHARGVLVDLGCGRVPLYDIYRPLVSEIICVDWDGSPHQTLHLDVVCDLNEQIDLPDACADTVLCTDVLEHIAEPQRLWSEMARILRPGGKLLAGVPFFYKVHEAPHDYHRYTEFRLRQLAEGSGLSVSMLEPYGGWPEVMGDISGRIVGHRHRLSAAHLALAQAFCRSAHGRRISAATAASFPLGYILVAESAPVSL